MMVIKHHSAHAAPMKVCRACGAKVHVRSKKCDQCDQLFARGGQQALSVDETVDTVLQAIDLVKKVGEAEAIKMIKKVSKEI